MKCDFWILPVIIAVFPQLIWLYFKLQHGAPHTRESERAMHDNTPLSAWLIAEFNVANIVFWIMPSNIFRSLKFSMSCVFCFFFVLTQSDYFEQTRQISSSYTRLGAGLLFDAFTKEGISLTVERLCLVLYRQATHTGIAKCVFETLTQGSPC